MAEDEKIEKLQAQMIDVLNLQKELKEQIPATKEEYLNLALKCLKNREGLREIIYIVVPQHLRKELLSKLDAKDSIHNDPIIKKAQEKFQEIKDGSKSADSGGILGGAKKKRNIDLKADEEPSKESTLSTYPSKYNPKKERFETRKGDLYLQPEKEPPKDQNSSKQLHIKNFEMDFTTLKVVLKVDLKKIHRKLSRSIHTHTTLDNLELSVIDTLKLIKKLLGGEDKE